MPWRATECYASVMQNPLWAESEESSSSIGSAFSRAYLKLLGRRVSAIAARVGTPTVSR